MAAPAAACETATVEGTSVSASVLRYFKALDARDWATCLSSFCETFDADYTAMVGGEPMVDLPREVNMFAWTGMMAGFDSTRHDVVPTAVRVADGGAGATFEGTVTATHVLSAPPAACLEGATITAEGAAVWTTVGRYEMMLQPGASPDSWRIRRIKFVQDSSTPAKSDAFMEEAKARAKAAGSA